MTYQKRNSTIKLSDSKSWKTRDYKCEKKYKTL